MIEQGFVKYITAGLQSLSIVVPGGFGVQLPKDLITATVPQAWTYRGILSTPLYSLTGQNALTTWEVQLDCHGFTMANAMTLARAIDSSLSGGFSGTFTDADSTVVLGIFKQPTQVDGYSDANQTFVRSLEYRIDYYQI